MNRTLKVALAAAGLALATQATAGITFFEQKDFQGQSFTTDKQVRNLERFGFNDRASSVEVTGQRWEVCEDVRFEGNCKVLRPGRYSSMSEMGLNNRASSVRAIPNDARIDDSRYGPEPMSWRDGKNYRRRGNERTFQADVTSVRAVVATPTQRCWTEPGPAAAPQSNKNIPGAVVGAVLGGILGHQIGGRGTSQDVATLGGAAAGGYLGSKVNPSTFGGSSAPAQPTTIQRCENVQSQTPTYYDVVYNFRGQEHRVQMTHSPGSTVTVNEKGEPRA